MLLDLVYQHQTASEVSCIAHIVGGKRCGKINQSHPIPSTILVCLIGKGYLSLTKKGEHRRKYIPEFDRG